MVAVIVGRFQVAALTEGHKHLFDQVAQYAEKLILLGVAPYPSERNPLPFDARRAVLWDYLAGNPAWDDVIIAPLRDRPGDNSEWVDALDEVVSALVGTSAVMIGGRDSFLDIYVQEFGNYPHVRVAQDGPFTSGTAARASLEPQWDSYDFRAGYVSAWQDAAPPSTTSGNN